jgi:hypothetical protein
MRKDARDLLEVLRFELQFLKDGGYGRAPKTPWRPQYIFEDSPTCMNFDSKDNPAPCSDCVLMYLVPPEDRSQKVPCRHIPLNDSRETLDSLYRYSNQAEIEETVEEWLQTTIHLLEEQRLALPTAHTKQPTVIGERMTGTPLYQKQHPKCANPACPTAFHWTRGGKFFRFRPDSVPALEASSSMETSGGIHGVRHYWLCERCSHVFDLVHEDGFGVTLKLLWPELPTAYADKELSAT